MRKMIWSAMALTALLGFAYPWRAAQAQGEVAKEARDSFTRALASHRAKKVDAAIDEFMKAYAADARVLTFNDEGLLDTAITALAGRLAANPSDLDLNFKLGELNNVKGYSEDSLKCYRKVLQVAPQSPQAAVAREEVRKLEAAIQAAKAVQQSRPAKANPATPPPDAQPPKPSAEEAAQNRIQRLQEELEAVKKENDEGKEKLEKLQKEYDELAKKADQWKFYYNRFFADPRNVQNLQQGR
ncbi:MAG: hypothetical protein HY303_13960 [Candidatus Wallbacteria bacterium]|nr:hypothetical protein [Candidatus Wallbacteria bacterium]